MTLKNLREILESNNLGTVQAFRNEDGDLCARFIPRGGEEYFKVYLRFSIDTELDLLNGLVIPDDDLELGYMSITDVVKEFPEVGVLPTVSLSDTRKYDNCESDLELYVPIAFEMVLDPVLHQTRVLETFLTDFIYIKEHHLSVFEDLGYKFAGSSIYEKERDYDDGEPYIVFKGKDPTGYLQNIYIFQNIYTGKLYLEMDGAILSGTPDGPMLAYNMTDLDPTYLQVYLESKIEKAKAKHL